MCAAGLISTAECSRKIGITDRSVRRLKARFNACAFYALYILFNSIQFISFLFYSIQRDENNETLQIITKENEKNEKYRKLRKLRKKGKMLLKHHDNVIFYIKTVYFFIHVKNENIAFFLFFVRFSFFRSFFFFFVIYELQFFY